MFDALDKRAKILLYADNLWYFGEGMLGPLFAVFTQRVGGDVLDISWAWAVYLIVTGLLIMFIGRISDEKIGKKRFLLAGYGLNALCTFSYLFVSAPIHLFLVQIGLGVSAALATPTWNALYSKYEQGKHAGYAWGLSDGQAQLLTGIALLIGGFIVAYFSFTMLFIVMGTIQTISFFYLFQLLKKEHRH